MSSYLGAQPNNPSLSGGSAESQIDATTATTEAINSAPPASAQQQAIDAAVSNIRSACAESVAKHRPKIIESANNILERAFKVRKIRNQAVSAIGDTLTSADTSAWYRIGELRWWEGKRQNYAMLRSAYNTWLQNKFIETVNSLPEGFRELSTGSTVKRSKMRVKTYGPLSPKTIPTRVWLDGDVQKSFWNDSGPNVPADTDWMIDSSAYCSWISDLENSYNEAIPDFAYVLEEVTSTGEELYSVLPEWPHGWLTNLESAIGILGYYSQVDAPADEWVSPQKPIDNGYYLFDSESIANLSRGDFLTGLREIMYGNHQFEESWTIRGLMPDQMTGGIFSTETAQTQLVADVLMKSYSSGGMGASTADPKEFIQETYQGKGGKSCDDINNKLELCTNNLSSHYGPSPAMKNFRPFSMLRSGGYLQQAVYNSSPTYPAGSSANPTPGSRYAKEGDLRGHLYSYVGIGQRLSIHSTRFRNLATTIDAEYVTAIMKARGFSTTGVSQEEVEVYKEKFNKLSSLLQTLAGVMNEDIKFLYGMHAELVRAHRDIIYEVCEAIEEETDFDSDDEWDWFGEDDDWDDHLGPLVQDSMGDPLEDLNQAFVGTGQTSMMFKEQCFLLSFVNDFAQTKKMYLDSSVADSTGTIRNKSKKRMPYWSNEHNVKNLSNNGSILLDGDAYGFLNRLTQNPRLESFYDILNHELSNLQPKIRLWKVIFDEDGNEKEIEVKFESHYSAADLDYFKSTDARGVGAGLKSFNFTYDGSNPFAVKKSIKANLKIFANTMSEILRDRPSSYVDKQGTRQSVTYKYSDLAMKTWNTKETNASNTEGNTGAECLPTFDLFEENTKKAELNFRLKAQVGWSVPIQSMSSIREEVREALEESYVTLNLTPTVHNFEIDDFGRVVFNINYLAYIEQFFDQSLFNVFSTTEIMMNRFERELRMKYYRTEANCSPEQINQQKSDFSEQVQTEQEQAISSLISDMITEDMIYYVNIPYVKIRDFLSYGPHKTYDQIVEGDDIQIRSSSTQDQYLKDRVGEALQVAFGDANGDGQSAEAGMTDDNSGAIRAALTGNDPRMTDLGFFYLSDLIDMLLLKLETGLTKAVDEIDTIDTRPKGNVISCEQKAAKKKDIQTAIKNFQKLRIMLGPMELTHPKALDGKASMWVNLGDCPISIKYFVEWLTNKMLKKDEVSYPLTKFMNDLINNLLKTFLNADNCFGYSIRQKTRLNQAAITSWGPNPAGMNLDPVSAHIIEYNKIKSENQDLDFTGWPMRGSIGMFNKLPVLNISGPSNSSRTAIPFDNEYNYFVFFAGRTMPMELMKGDKELDSQRGIFHYRLGRDRGLLKNIKLTKTQTKGLAEVRFEQEGYDGLEQLRVVYDAQVDMFASVGTFPGTYIYIDPRGFAPEGSGDDEFRLTDLGIGGYYMIIRSEHEFAEGKANTILHTKWVNQLDSDEEERQKQQTATDSAGTGGTVSRRCAIRLRAQPEAEMPEPPGFFSTIASLF